MEQKKNLEGRTPADAASGSTIEKSKWYDNGFIWIAALAVIVLVIFSSFLFDGSKMLFGSDTIGGLDTRIFYRTAIDKFHQFPFWFNCRLSGMPSIDALFGDALYPPSFFAFSVLPVFRALGMRLVFHIILAGLLFYLLLRKGFRTSPLVAFLGGAFYMLNPEFFSHIYPGHDGKMFVISLLPFVVWMCKSLLEKPRLLTATFFAASIALCLYTSHIQMTYFVLIGLFLYWVMHTVLLYKKEKKASAVLPAAGYFWMAVALGMGVALLQLLPPFQFIRDAFSVRGVDRGFEYAASWSLHWPEIFSMWVPEFGNTLQNYWSENPFKLNSEYAGAMAIMFSVIALCLKAKPWRLFWGGMCVAALLFSLGAHTPFFKIAYYVLPGVKKFRACSMVMFWFSFGTVLLTSLFFKDVINGVVAGFSEQQRKKWQKGIIIALGCITAAVLLFSIKDVAAGIMGRMTESLSNPQKSRIFDANFSKNFVPFLWVWWVFAVTCLALLWGVVAGKVNKYILVAVVLIIGLIDTIRVDAQFIKVIDPRPYFSSEPAIVDLQQKMASEPFRCFTLPGSLPQNAEGVHLLEGVGGFHDNELQWYREFRGDQQDMNFLTNLVGVMADNRPYLISENMKNGNAFLNLANAQYYLVRQGEKLLAIKNEAALGRVSFAGSYIVLDSSRIIEALRSGAYDVKKTVALFKEPQQRPSPAEKTADSLSGDSQGLISTTWEKYTPNYRKVKVSAPRDGFLRISEVYYPGWNVRVDSKPVPIYRADLAWMAINISKGDHVVEMIPHSLYIKKAAWVSFPLMALVALYWIFVAVRRKAAKASTL